MAHLRKMSIPCHHQSFCLDLQLKHGVHMYPERERERLMLGGERDGNSQRDRCIERDKKG